MLSSDKGIFKAQESVSVLLPTCRNATFSSTILEVPNFEHCNIRLCDLVQNTFFTTFIEIWVLINARATSEICIVQVLKMSSPTASYKIFYC